MAKLIAAASLVAAVTMVMPAKAHVTLQAKETQVGAPYRAVFQVPHGCAGSATTGLRVQIPEGVIAVKPVAKTGWKVDVVTGKYRAGYAYQGSQLSEGAREVVWSGGNLPDRTHDEFVIDTFVATELKPNAMLYFPVVQECEKGVSRWIDIPPGGEVAHGHEGKTPAPGVRLMPKP